MTVQFNPPRSNDAELERLQRRRAQLVSSDSCYNDPANIAAIDARIAEIEALDGAG